MAITLSFIPDPTTATLYKTQKLFLQVKFSSTTPLPPNEKVALAIGAGFEFDTTAIMELPYSEPYSQPQPIILDPSDSTGKTGFANFILDVKTTATVTPHSNLTVTAISAAAPPFHATYTKLGEQLAPILSGPSKPWVPIPGTDNLNPATGIEYTIVYSATMKDPLGALVPNCVIDWHERDVAGVRKNLFTSKMHTYVTKNSLTPIVDDNHTYWPDSPLAQDPNSSYKFIRTITGSDGVASLYLVAKNSTGQFVSGVETWTGTKGDYSTPFFSVATVDLTTISLPNVAPDPGDKDAATGFVDYTADSDLTVPVNLNLSSQTVTRDDLIYTFINGQLGSIISWSDSDFSLPYQSTFPKQLGKTGTDLIDQNTLQFLWVDLSGPTFYISAGGFFYGEHDPFVTPTGGTLLPPYLPDAGNAIDDTVAANPINVAVYLTPQTTVSPPWTPAPNDSIVVYANINGYDKNGQPRQPITVPSASYSIQPSDITAGVKILTLDNTKFQGWSHSVAGSNYRSTFLMYYMVARANVTPPWKSKNLPGYVMTPNS